jgi:hypothetical protein
MDFNNAYQVIPRDQHRIKKLVYPALIGSS